MRLILKKVYKTLKIRTCDNQNQSCQEIKKLLLTTMKGIPPRYPDSYRDRDRDSTPFFVYLLLIQLLKYEMFSIYSYQR